jgi:hypothetical protein
LTYSGLPQPEGKYSLDNWLNFLDKKTSHYTARPYQQLAAAYRRNGHESETRKILMRQREAQIEWKAIRTRRGRLWARFTGLTLGYGYQPWRALIGLLSVFALSIVLAFCYGQAFVHTKNALAPGTPCTRLERIGVGLDLGVPILKTTTRSQCDLTMTATGEHLLIITWILQILAWVFATLFIAGFTGAVRKT